MTQYLARHKKKIMGTAVSGFGIGGMQEMEKSDKDSAKITSIDSITVSAAVLGDLFSVSDRRIRQMAEEGTLARAAKGRYKLADSIKSYLLTLKLAADTAGIDLDEGEIDLDEEKGLHERVKRHISELKLQIMKGELHKAEDVQAVMMDMLASFKTRVMAIPSKAAPVLENRDAAYIKNRLTDEVIEVLNELKDYNPKMFYSDEYIESVDDYEQQEQE